MTMARGFHGLFFILVIYSFSVVSSSLTKNDINMNRVFKFKDGIRPKKEERDLCKPETYKNRKGFKLIYYDCDGEPKICKNSIYRYYFELWTEDNYLIEILCARYAHKHSALEYECSEDNTHIFNVNPTREFIGPDKTDPCLTMEFTVRQNPDFKDDYKNPEFTTLKAERLEVGLCNSDICKREIINCKRKEGQWCFGYFCFSDLFMESHKWIEDNGTTENISYREIFIAILYKFTVAFKSLFAKKSS